MAPKPSETLTRLELEIMQAIWKLGPSSVGAVQEALGRPLAYTTVQTMLNILEKKGKLKRNLKGRSFRYQARVTRAAASGHAVRDLVDRMFGGSNEELVMSLIKSRQLDAAKIAEWSRRLEDEAVETEARKKG